MIITRFKIGIEDPNDEVTRASMLATAEYLKDINGVETSTAEEREIVIVSQATLGNVFVSLVTLAFNKIFENMVHMYYDVGNPCIEQENVDKYLKAINRGFLVEAYEENI